MAARLAGNALKGLTRAAPKPSVGGAARRNFASSANSGESEFERIWIQRDVYPIVYVLGVGVMYCAYTVRGPPRSASPSPLQSRQSLQPSPPCSSFPERPH
jgi:hypothetical protein